MNGHWNELLQININHGYLLQILLAELLYARYLDRRSHIRLRAVLGVSIFLLASIVVPNWMSRYVAGFFTLSIFLFSVLLVWYCFRASFRQLIFCCVAGQLTQNLAYNIEGMVRYPFRTSISTGQWFCLSVTVMVCVYALCGMLFGRRMRRINEAQLGVTTTYIASIIAVIFVYFIHFMYQQYGILELWITRPPLILVCILGLGMQFGWVELQGERAEVLLLEQMIEREKQHYEMSRQSIDLINLKAHDLKHQLNLLKNRDHLDPAEIQNMEEVLDVYESAYKTGNSTLDVVLGEKQLVCTQNDIALIAMAEGSALSFMSTADIASLFGNALDNAIECELKIPEKALRYISVSVSSKGNMVSIRVENYSDVEQAKDAQGNYLTSKENKEYHGFGLKSIAYIAEKYHGTMKIEERNCLFVLSIVLRK